MTEFEGILSRPIPIAKDWDTVDEDRIAFFEAEKKEREEALIRHFGYRPDEPDVWYKVALSLAELVVPAYQPPRGRPDKYRFRVQGWACYWVTLMLTGTRSDTEAFDLIGEYVGVASKTVRERLRAFSKDEPEAMARTVVHFKKEIEIVGPETALRYAQGEAWNDEFSAWHDARVLRSLEGRAPEPSFRTFAEMHDHAERKSDRRK